MRNMNVNNTIQRDMIYPSTTIAPSIYTYWVGADECGIMVVTLDVHAIKGLDNLQTVEAANSNQARILYASTL